MLELLAAVLLASLLGSAHCAGMCGPFVLLASEPRLYSIAASKPVSVSPWLLAMTYHVSRLVVYLILGYLAGLLGSAIDLGGSAVGVQRSAAMLSGFLMVIIGLGVLFKNRLSQPVARLLPKRLVLALQSLYRGTMNLPAFAKSLTIGALSVLLPCGWLYLFVVTASATARPITGMLVMAAFWLGTVPALSVVRLGFGSLSNRLRTMLPSIAAWLVIFSGTYVLFVRAPADYSSLTKRSASETIVAINAGEPLPCCLHGEK
jgi:hypothetical protein